MTYIFNERQYSAVDSADLGSSRPDFSVLIYAGGFLDKENSKLRDDIKERVPAFHLPQPPEGECHCRVEVRSGAFA